MAYSHTQRGKLHLILVLGAAAALGGVWTLLGEPLAAGILGGVASVTLVCACCFRDLTIEDEGERLLIRFGPCPLFKKRIPYAEMQTAAAGRSPLIAGWGIHYVFRDGWTYNIWGRDCVNLTTARGNIRLGTDDVAGLLAHLREKGVPR